MASLTGSGSSSGVIGGGQIGYNWQVKQFVLGVEADLVGTDLKGSSASATRSFGPPLILATVTQTVTVDFGHIDWMASFRGRLGFAVDRALFYVTGGAAVAEFGGSSDHRRQRPGHRHSGRNVHGHQWRHDHPLGLDGRRRHRMGVQPKLEPGRRISPYRFRQRGHHLHHSRRIWHHLRHGNGNSRLTVDQATARLNYRFGGPVVARY